MPTTQVQFRRGTTAQNNSFTGASGEVTVDTTNNSLRVHDGLTPGGYALPTLSSNGSISVSGNITASYFLGNGACLSGISSSAIFSGLSNVRITASDGNIAANVGSTSNVVIIANSGVYVSGLLSATGNITGGNLSTGIITSTGNISTTGNITGGNLSTGIITSTGNISTTGNITGNYIFGNGVSLTGVITSVANINNGTSNVTVVSSGGNITVGVGGVGNIAVFAATGMTVSNVSITGNVTGAGILNPFLLAGM
jgi:hypothetical protein